LRLFKKRIACVEMSRYIKKKISYESMYLMGGTRAEWGFSGLSSSSESGACAIDIAPIWS